MEFAEDNALNERLGDLEFNGVTYDQATAELRLQLSDDPVEAGRLLRFRTVMTFEVSGFGLQNVISHLEYVLLENDRIHEFLAIANAEIGRSHLAIHDQRQGRWLGAILVPSNGAIVYAVCESVELCDAGESVLHRIAA